MQIFTVTMDIAKISAGMRVCVLVQIQAVRGFGFAIKEQLQCRRYILEQKIAYILAVINNSTKPGCKIK